MAKPQTDEREKEREEKGTTNSDVRWQSGMMLPKGVGVRRI